MRENGLQNDSRVAECEIIRVKNDIRSQLRSVEEKLLTNLPKQLSDSMELVNTQALRQHVSNWIKHGTGHGALVDYLCTAIYEKRIERFSRFGNNLKKLGVNLSDVDGDTKLTESDSGCKWVPAAFSQLDGRKAYGGVFLRPNLSSQSTRGFQGFQVSTKNAGSSGSSKGGSNGGGSSGGGSSKGGSNGGGTPPSSPPPKHLRTMTRKEIDEKYGHGKGWPKEGEPIRLRYTKTEETYFGKPGTSKKFYHC